MANTVKTDFELGNLNAYIKGIETAEKRLADFAAKTTNLGSNVSVGNVVSGQVRQIESDFLSLEKKALSLQVSLKKSLEIPRGDGFSSLTKSAENFYQSTFRAQNELRALSKTASLTTDAGVLKTLNTQADKLKAGLRDAERELTRIRQIDNANGVGGAGGGSFGDSFINRIGGSAFSGGLSGGVVGGLAGGAVLAGVSALKSGVSELAGSVEDLSVKSVTLAGNFEETRNALAVFAGSTAEARRELSAIDKIALNTPGLKLEVAEVGYQRLRALNFEAKLSQDLIKGLGTQRVLSGASSDAVDRVITNLIQLKSGAGTATDVRQTIGQLPTLLPVFQKAFGTQDFGDINKAFKTDPQALQKFAAELSKTQSAQAGLNVSIEKGSDALAQAGRVFGEPILDPLTKDIQGLTKLLNENQSTFARWGQSAADALRGVSEAASAIGGSQGGGVAGRVLGAGVRGSLAIGTYGISETAIRGFQTFSDLGRKSREKQEAEDANKSFSELVSKNGGFETKTASGLVVGAVGAINEAVLKIPSLNKQLETEEAKKQAKELAENIRKVSGEIAEFGVKSQIDTGTQNLEISKAIAVRDAKGDGLKIAKETAALEIANLKEQILLSDKLFAAKTQNLSSDDFKAGKGLLLSRENEANVSKLNSQILLTQINSQKQINDEIKKGVEKAKELGKAYQSTFDNLFVETSRDNPLAQVFSEGDRAIDKLRENLKGLKPELLAIAESLQKTANDNKEFGTRLDNDLSALDLKQKADDLRKFGKDISRPNELTLDKTDPKKFFTDFIDYYSKQIELGANRLAPIYAAESNFGGNVRVDRNPFTNFHANIFADKNGKQYTAGFSQSNALEELTNDFDRVSKADGSFGGFSRRTRSFADLTEKEKLQFLDKDNVGFQNKLSAAFDVAGNRTALNDEQQSSIDKKIIALSSGVRPEQLTDNQREVIAKSLEKEAERKEQAETKAQKEREKQSEYQKNISEYINTLKGKAASGGSSAVEVTIKDETSAGAEAKQQSAAPNRDNVEEYYRNGGSFNLIRR